MNAASDDVGFDHTKFDDAAEWLHEKGRFSPSMITEKEPLALVREINRVLKKATTEGFADNVIPPAMAKKLDNSLFLFSGFKTMHELSEAGHLLRSVDGTVKSFSAFLTDVRKIDDTYNERYLRAEYEFAISSAQMAARWGDHSEGAMLQYRTASDEKVRETHAALNGITLPKEDSFWDSYYAPNGWGCRCNVVVVRSGKHPVSDSKEACEKGNEALSTQGKKGLIFKFNPGKHGQIFPPKHPYYCRQMGRCEKIDLSLNNPMCAGCQLLNTMLEHYKNIPTKKGSLAISNRHGKTETKENVEIGTYLAETHGHDLFLLPITKDYGTKSADAFNVTLQRKQEFKRPIGNKANTIDRNLRDAAKQASHIVLDIKVEISEEALKNTIYDRTQRTPNIEHVTIIRNGVDATYTRAEILDFGRKAK